MKVLLLGVGMQGKAALHDLVNSAGVDEIIAADWDIDSLAAYGAKMAYGAAVRFEPVDAGDKKSLARLLDLRPCVVIDLLPGVFHNAVAEAAVDHGVHLVHASYVSPEMKKLSQKAREKNIVVLPEFGLDPGIDLVLLGEAVRGLDIVEEILSYGAGLPELVAAGNPLKYKVSWTFEGVLKAYRRGGRMIRASEEVLIGRDEMFIPEHIHEIDIEGLGILEAYPNGDALKYAEQLGIDQTGLQALGRFTMRWPGHAAFWRDLVALKFLDDEPVIVNGAEVDRNTYLAALLEPQLQYQRSERDVVVVRVEVAGTQNGQKTRRVFQVVDRRDLQTGFTAMSRTVGYTASIGAQMICNGQIKARGVLSPLRDVPYRLFVKELTERNIVVTSHQKAGEEQQ